MKLTRRAARKDDIHRRVATTIDAYDQCRMFGCTRPTTATARKGLNRLYCRRHEDHFERHGSYVKSSYSAAELNPYRRALHAWLAANQGCPAVAQAVSGVVLLYRRAGPHVEAFRLAGKRPAERARAAWARLREAQIDPIRPVAAWLAVEMKLRDDPHADRHIEYKRVQAAKLVHRMASGSHKRWEQDRPNGKVVITEMHKYPANRGLVLRHIGKALEHASSDIFAMHSIALFAHVAREVTPLASITNPMEGTSQ